MQGLKLGFFLLLFGFIQLSAESKPIFCYWSTWSHYRNGEDKFRVENIDGSLCTHIMYAFFGISIDGNIQIRDQNLDLNRHNIQKTVALKRKWPHLKIVASIGGWKAGSKIFSAVARDARSRESFARNALGFVKKYRFDGVDVDWEYPGLRGGDKRVDKHNFVLLMEAVYKKLHPLGYTVTIATPAYTGTVKTSFELSKLHSFVDYLLLMAYDYHSFRDRVTGHNAPLKDGPSNIKTSISYYLSQGVPVKKLVLGIPLYGQTFKLSNSNFHGVGAPTTGRGGTLAFSHICRRVKRGYKSVWDASSQVPYAYLKDEWISFDDVKSVTLKSRYAQNLGLGGTMVWSVDFDDFTGSCGIGKNPLLTAIHNVMK